MRVNGKRQRKNHDVPSFALIVFSESPCVASLAAVATSRRGHFEKYINFNLSSYKACLRFILINTAGALVVTAVCKGPLVGGIHSIQSIPLPFFAQKPIKPYIARSAELSKHLAIYVGIYSTVYALLK